MDIIQNNKTFDQRNSVRNAYIRIYYLYALARNEVDGSIPYVIIDVITEVRCAMSKVTVYRSDNRYLLFADAIGVHAAVLTCMLQRPLMSMNKQKLFRCKCAIRESASTL